MKQKPMQPAPVVRPERRQHEEPPCAPGSIEQHLDMCESKGLRGDEIEHHHGMFPPPSESGRRLDATEIMDRMNVDMSEENREGMELSGDEHSAGLQGEEAASLPNEKAGLPGETLQEEQRNEARSHGLRASIRQEGLEEAQKARRKHRSAPRKSAPSS